MNPRTTIRNSLRSLAAVCVAGFMAGCAGMHPAPQVAEPAAAPVWPAPPDPARIAYVRSFSRAADLGIKPSVFGRIGRWITGSDKGNESMVKPFGLGLDEEDNIVVSDTGSASVTYYDRVRKKTARWNKIGAVRLSAPVAVAKHAGVFYVADTGLGAVVMFDASGKLTGLITNRLARPAGLAVLNEQLYVADSQRHAVLVFDLAGNCRSEFGRRGRGVGEFNYPTHVAADRHGDLYVTDSMNGRVQVFDAAGNFKRMVGALGDGPGAFSRPKGVSTDTTGNVYVVDALFDNFQIFDGSGRLLMHLGEMGAGPGEFWMPNGIVISRANEILVADSYNRRVQIFKYIGEP